jgi:hypothetical protein
MHACMHGMHVHGLSHEITSSAAARNALARLLGRAARGDRWRARCAVSGQVSRLGSLAWPDAADRYDRLQEFDPERFFKPGRIRLFSWRRLLIKGQGARPVLSTEN